MSNTENTGNNVIMPEEIESADVKIVINMADVMERYQLALKSHMEYGIRVGQELARSGNILAANQAPKIQEGASETQKLNFIGIADKFSYGAYTNKDSFEKALQFYHSATSEISYFNKYEDALSWAYQTCCDKNPGKAVPYNDRKNWRNKIKDKEKEGGDS